MYLLQKATAPGARAEVALRMTIAGTDASMTFGAVTRH